MNARDIIKLAAKLYIDDYLSGRGSLRQNAKINQELLEIQKTLDEIEKQGDM